MYIPSHAALGNHPKLRRLARTLAVSRPAAIGHLHYLWWWSQEYAPDGDLSYQRYTAEDIADAALWEGDAYAFVDALKTSGFVDDVDGRLLLHDWEEYGGKIVKDLAKDRERKRSKGNPPTSTAVPESSAAIPDTSTGNPAEIHRNSGVDKNREEEINLTPPTPSPGEPADKPPRAVRGSRIPPDFTTTPALYAYAADKEVTAAEADSVTEGFILYWQSASGRNAIKIDWNKAWMNRVLDLLAAGKIGPAARTGSMRSNGYQNQASINRGGQKNPDGTPRWSE